MATLQVKDFPDDLDEKLKLLAEREKRSISQQTTLIIEEVITQNFGIKRKKLFEEIAKLTERVNFQEDPTDWIRSDSDS